MNDTEYGLWEACPNDSILAMGIDGTLHGSVFVPTEGHESWRGNPDEIRSFKVEWSDWVFAEVLDAIFKLQLGDSPPHTGQYVVYRDDGSRTKVVVGSRGEPHALYLIAYKM